MKRVDVAIIGAGVAGRLIADRLAERKKETALIALPGNPEDYFRTLLTSLSPMPSSRNVLIRDRGDHVDPGLKHSGMTTRQMPRFVDSKTLNVDGDTITANHFVIASGSLPHVPAELQTKNILLPLQALAMDPAPKAVTVLGAGPIGVATAATLAKRGCAVTLIVRGERLLRKIDADISTAVQTWLASLGVRVQPPATESPQGPLVVAAGTVANIAGLGLEKTGVFVTPEGNVAVDEEARTSSTSFHAAGAVTGPSFNLALENVQADAAAENIGMAFFMRKRIFPEPLPYALPLDPPLAWIGDADEKSFAVTVPFGPWRVKIIGRKKTAELLGARAFCPGADALILYFNLLMRAGVSLRDVRERHHYPGLGIAEMAAEAVDAWFAAAG